MNGDVASGDVFGRQSVAMSVVKARHVQLSRVSVLTVQRSPLRTHSSPLAPYVSVRLLARVATGWPGWNTQPPISIRLAIALRVLREGPCQTRPADRSSPADAGAVSRAL